MNTTNKFLIFEELLSAISTDNKMQLILKSATLKEVRHVFEHASLNELQQCVQIASNQEQYELCVHLKQLIKEREIL